VAYLCDTNVISEIMRRAPEPVVERWLKSLETINISVVTVEEIHCGLAHRDAHRQLGWFQEFCDQCCTVLPLDAAVAAHAGALRGQLLRLGRRHSQADMLIAATAAMHKLTVATRNVADFDHCGVAVLNPFPPPVE
jgi:predicted nucleic acid-binding protein